MKQLTCEMCGSTELVKQDGYFVCQTCGTKYSVEEAKKMMIEGTVDVSGSTIKVDTTADTQNNILNARRAMRKEDWIEAERYYNLAEQNDPSNIEAIFYSSYSKARSLMIESDHFKREHGLTVLRNCLSIIDENYRSGDISMITKISDDLIKLCQSSFVYKGIDENKLILIYQAFTDIHCSWMTSLINIAEGDCSEDEKHVIYTLVLKHYADVERLKINFNAIPSLDTYQSSHKARVWLVNNSDYGEKQYDYCANKEIKTLDDVHEIFIKLRDLAKASHPKSIELFNSFRQKYPFAGLLCPDRTYVDEYNNFKTVFVDAGASSSSLQKTISVNPRMECVHVTNHVPPFGKKFAYIKLDKIVAKASNKIELKINPTWDVEGTYKELKFTPEEYPEALKLFKLIGGLVRFLGNNKCELNLNPNSTPSTNYTPSTNSPPKTNVSSSGGGCYVATCVYGSYDCPEVWTLRRYRDDTLGSTWCGRLFIRTYYAISPTIVKWFGNTNWFKRLWKGKLDRMVGNLQAKGVASTPYEDKKW